MKATQSNLLKLINGPKQFIIPIYQRTYSWDERQCKQLFEDILTISRNSHIHGHFIGSIVYFQESIHTQTDVPKLLIIDGQQRLTTVTLLIATLADFIEKNSVKLETSAKKLKNYYLFNAEEEDDLYFKLLLTKRDKEVLKNVLKGIPLTNDESILKISQNYNFFKSKITKENIKEIYNGLMQLFIVEVALEKNVDNPQLIFESLNSTGLDLSQADLIRNYVLMDQEVDFQKELYEKYWYPMEQSFGSEYSLKFNRFIRDYLSMITGNIPKINDVYTAFKNYIKNSTSNNNIKDVVEDIYKFSNYYVNMALHKEPIYKLKMVFKRITQLKVDVAYPFILAVYDDFKNSYLSEKDFFEILCLIENYVFRRLICGLSTNSLNKTFLSLYKSINKKNYLESLQGGFLLMSSYKRFPMSSEFEKELLLKDIYNLRNRNYLLNRLENYGRKENVIVDEYTIEHIMPQNPRLSLEWQESLGDNWKEVQEKYLHTLGNLTLTGYNFELSDRPFNEKKTMKGGFNDSPIRLNEYMRKVNKWSEKQIKTRAKLLANKATRIWFEPSLSEETLLKYKYKKSKKEVYTIKQYEHLSGHILNMYNCLRKKILNIDSSVRDEFTKLYIAYKATTNFVDIEPQKTRLKLTLNIDYDKIIDPNNICRDMTGIGNWGNGNTEVILSKHSEIDYIMELILQAYEEQSN